MANQVELRKRLNGRFEQRKRTAEGSFWCFHLPDVGFDLHHGAKEAEIERKARIMKMEMSDFLIDEIVGTLVIGGARK
jgi:hypothetical protein